MRTFLFKNKRRGKENTDFLFTAKILYLYNMSKYLKRTLSLFFIVKIEFVAAENIKLSNDVIDKTGEPQAINITDRILDYWQHYWPWK